jgi:hypothetical protein
LFSKTLTRERKIPFPKKVIERLGQSQEFKLKNLTFAKNMFILLLDVKKIRTVAYSDFVKGFISLN